jgi:hypothetical protein
MELVCKNAKYSLPSSTQNAQKTRCSTNNNSIIRGSYASTFTAVPSTNFDKLADKSLKCIMQVRT